jgi:hypothetical protein
MSDRRQVPEGMALYKGEFVTARMVVERLVEAERLLRICTDGREAYIKSVNTVLEITKFLGTADSDEWPTQEEAEKRAAELMAIGRATKALDKRERDWMAAREEALDRARKDLIQHDSYCAAYDGQHCTCGGASGNRDATLQQGGAR